MERLRKHVHGLDAVDFVALRYIGYIPRQSARVVEDICNPT